MKVGKHASGTLALFIHLIALGVGLAYFYSFVVFMFVHWEATLWTLAVIIGAAAIIAYLEKASTWP